jgi:hypothetical protein
MKRDQGTLMKVRPGMPAVLCTVLALLTACGAGNGFTAVERVTQSPITAHAATPGAATPAVGPASSAAATSAQMCVSGLVVSGGDTTPQGLADTPRTFTYLIKRDDRTTVNLSYTSFPPSANDQARIRLDFHAGTITPNDYAKACGRYEQTENMIVVAQPGDYIETYAQPPQP